MITVYCDSPSHPERRWECMRFRRTENGWHGSTIRFKSELHRRAGEIKTMVWLDTERRYLTLGEAIPAGARARVRPRLVCGLCDAAFVRGNPDLLYAVLDMLAAAGQTRISLQNLNAEAASIESVTK